MSNGVCAGAASSLHSQDNLLNVLLTRSLPWEMTTPAAQ